MGANAVTSVFDFTAGQVLTAAQMDNVNCGIPVFATTITRDAAFGGTGEKVLAEGQLCYIEALDLVQYYNGSAWVTASASYQYAQVLTLQSTTSSTYTDLATVGPSITATTGTTALVTFTATCDGTTIGSDQALASVAVSGATTVAASDDWSTNNRTGSNLITVSRTYQFTGLTAGSNTFTMKYRNSSGLTGRFQNRGLVVWGF